MFYRSLTNPAVVMLSAAFLISGIASSQVLAEGSSAPAGSGSLQVASLADEADLSRSVQGETFEDNSHSLHDELSGAGGDHGLESEHGGLESEHGGEGERGGGSEGGGEGGDSGGEGGDR